MLSFAASNGISSAMTVLIFIAVLAVLVLSHEFGHFIFAKKAGLRVEEFGFGFPPRLLGVQRINKEKRWRFIWGPRQEKESEKESEEGDTVYSVNMIPLGGFVRIHGENGGEVEDKKSFGSQPLYIRALILVAGVFFNLLLAWPVLTAGFLIGTPASVNGGNISGGTLTEKGVMILEVQKGTSAEAAGLKEGDYLLRFISKDNDILQVSDEKSVQDFIAKYAGAEITIDYLRGKKEFSAKAIPSVKPEAGKGSLGIAMERVGIMKLPFHLAVWEGLKSTIRLTVMISKALFAFFGDLFTERKMIVQLSGPVGIAGMLGSAAQTGFVFFLQLVAVLSIHLALINIIPFPALDGGRLLFLAIEFVKGKPISQKVSNIAHNIGFAMLILLMLIITYRDILKLVK
ncbi:MAG: RIP metalloprotease RseP [Candidatus Tagabacteria bacterium CG03_land_8_20_14_0_80_41_22]|uniref:Zinc metalloprotease n=3 Tax=Candidatus Tagaibacteriota TaxID=1817918 RepID=A0A2M7B9Q7_9BACT|nr:MAG: RIP metalloprotease RseP [Candidatus Tagabacteria bacterium CG11_big_fil_rev_8_21_14_0_20_41_11]PIU99811.1 MAG: RIP metalloprotease RseP [Candidatus Tagabacteria bacterium CG03_land_8_20_14_0_80_41_22]